MIARVWFSWGVPVTSSAIIWLYWTGDTARGTVLLV